MKEIKQIVISHDDPLTRLANAILEADEDTVIMVPSLFVHRLAMRAARQVGKQVMVAIGHGK